MNDEFDSKSREELIELVKYYRSEHVNVAIYWKQEIESHKKTKDEFQCIKLRYKDLQQKYYSLIDKVGSL